jgi:hypothetical protein
MNRANLGIAWALLAAMLAHGAFAQATVRQQDTIYTLENPHFRIQVDSAAGARITSWTLKPSGRDLIALWKGADEIGGALDDRSFFTAVRYDASITQPGPETATLRLESRHSSGLSILKILTIRKDAPALEVSYEFRNGTQTPQRLFIRNFFLPGSKPQTGDHLYWVNADPAAGRKPVEAQPDAGQYYAPAAPAFAALWDRATGDGILAFVPGADKFYFWRDSREFPTFEWLYADVPPGKILQAGALLVTVSDQKAAPDWRALTAAHGARTRAARLLPLPDWVDEATKFNVTDAERRRGFWLSIGAEEFKQRLPETVPVDLPLEDDRYVPVAINVLKDFAAPVRVEIPPDSRRQVEALWETPGPDRRELLPFDKPLDRLVAPSKVEALRAAQSKVEGRPVPEKPFTFKSGGRETLWLRVSGREKAQGDYEIPVKLVVGESVSPISLRLRVWSVTVTTKRPFHLRGYYGGFSVLTGGYEINEKNLRRLDALLTAYAEIGGDVLDWTCGWNRVIEKVKITDTGENLAEVAKKTPERLDLNRLPRLNLSYFDPWLDLAKKHGVTRLETYMSYPTDARLQWALLDPAVGKGRVKVGTPEADRVIVWFYREMRQYFDAKGLDVQFCKISDEISPEHIPSYIAAAKLAREAGWRPFTTITGMVARTAEHIRTMNPWCDEWQLGFGSKDEFLRLTQMKFVLEEQRLDLKVPWGEYHNGGAQATWGAKVFGDEGATRVKPETVEKIELLEDGTPLPIKGGSPWGNTDRGVVITGGALKQHLYVSPRDEADPKTHRYELGLTVRRESPTGWPLVTLDPTDELWCYGGGSNPYRGSYHAAWCYPVMTLHHGFRGYGLWAFVHWQKTENIVWVDPETCRVTVSPAYCGYRDGWRDALLFSHLIEQRGRGEYDKVVGMKEGVPLRVGPRTTEVYHYTTVLNAADPLGLNAARRAALEQLGAGASGR